MAGRQEFSLSLAALVRLVTNWSFESAAGGGAAVSHDRGGEEGEVRGRRRWAAPHHDSRDAFGRTGTQSVLIQRTAALSPCICPAQ